MPRGDRRRFPFALTLRGHEGPQEEENQTHAFFSLIKVVPPSPNIIPSSHAFSRQDEVVMCAYLCVDIFGDVRRIMF